jgi:CDP-diacylglycerol--glycerol-3-phosphate 3-phosphatidyltransferase
MNLPNKITVARIASIPLIVMLLLAPTLLERNSPFGPYFAFADESTRPLVAGLLRSGGLLLTIAAALSDWYDGMLARKHNMQTRLGALLDPLADKLLVSAAFVVFVDLGLYPSWLVIIILFREFLVSGLRTIAAASGRVISADKWGKHKTGWQLATIITTIVFVAARDFLRAADLWDSPLLRNIWAEQIHDVTLRGLLFVTVTLTLLSGYRYMRDNWSIIKEEAAT